MVSKKINKIKTKHMLDYFKIITWFVSVLLAVTFFVYQMQGLPPRVSKLEKDLPETKDQLKNEIDNLRSQIDKSNAKQDIILDDVKTIKSLMMQKTDKF